MSIPIRAHLKFFPPLRSHSKSYGGVKGGTLRNGFVLYATWKARTPSTISVEYYQTKRMFTYLILTIIFYFQILLQLQNDVSETNRSPLADHLAFVLEGSPLAADVVPGVARSSRKRHGFLWVKKQCYKVFQAFSSGFMMLFTLFSTFSNGFMGVFQVLSSVWIFLGDFHTPLNKFYSFGRLFLVFGVAACS